MTTTTTEWADLKRSAKTEREGERAVKRRLADEARARKRRKRQARRDGRALTILALTD